MSSARKPSSKPSPTEPATQVTADTKGIEPLDPVAEMRARTWARTKTKVIEQPVLTLGEVAPTLAVPIPQEQYDLPVTFDPSGKILTLRQILEPGASPVSLSSLAPEKLVELTSLRIAAKPDFEIAMISAGLVNKTRALKEIAAHTEVGHLLVEIEQRVIQRVLDRAQLYMAYECLSPVETEQYVFEHVYE